jgi:pyruvyl transferase EpsO
VFTGGGNFGDLWDRHQLYREHVARTFPDRRIVVLPQTVHFRDAANLERAAASFRGHPDLHLIARDAVSHAVLRDAFPEHHVAMAPDMALFLTDFAGAVGGLTAGPPDHDTLYLLRGDIEKVDARGNPNFGPHWVDWTAEAAIDGAPIGPLADEAIAAAGAGDLVRSEEDRDSWGRFVFGCALLSRGRRLVTDRLHGHILAMVMGVENRLLDNVYSKHRTFYESWTHASPICDFSPTLSPQDP